MVHSSKVYIVLIFNYLEIFSSHKLLSVTISFSLFEKKKFMFLSELRKFFETSNEHQKLVLFFESNVENILAEIPSSLQLKSHSAINVSIIK